jgi:hypothetical protein
MKIEKKFEHHEHKENKTKYTNEKYKKTLKPKLLIGY